MSLHRIVGLPGEAIMIVNGIVIANGSPGAKTRSGPRRGLPEFYHLMTGIVRRPYQSRMS